MALNVAIVVWLNNLTIIIKVKSCNKEEQVDKEEEFADKEVEQVDVVIVKKDSN